MKKGHKKFFIIFLICVLIFATHLFWAPLPARFLLVRDNIHKADAIVVLSGDWEFGREKKAAELYKNGFADTIIRIFEKENQALSVMSELFNVEVTQEEAYRRYFESQGAHKEALILGGTVATSTFDELKAAKKIVLKNGFKSIIVVTNNYHMRRSLMTAQWIFRGKGIKIYNATAHSESFPTDRWWLHEEDIKRVTLEWLSIFFYLVYHFALGK